MKVSVEVFERVYNQLLYKLYLNEPNAEISFYTGEWDREEGYKRIVWDNAQSVLRVSEWRKGQGDSRFIIDCINEAMNPRISNNLLSENSYTKATMIFLQNVDRAAKIFYELFQEGNEQDAACFAQLSKMLEPIYDAFSVVAYFFFLKNKDQYVPVRKDGATERLAKLGIACTCMLKCNWNNYMEYVGVVKELMTYLTEKNIGFVTLLDAQSFLWMLYKIRRDTPEYHVGEIEKNKKVEEEIAVEEMTDAELYERVRFVEEGPVPTYVCSTIQRKRNPYLPEIVRRRAAGICQLCESEAPFKNKKGQPYLEAHHIIPLAENGSDILENMAALCPNCHTKMHILNEPNDVEKLKRKAIP